MNLTDGSSQKLKDILNSIFHSYNQGIKSDEGKYSKPKGKKQNSALDYFTINLNQKVGGGTRF